MSEGPGSDRRGPLPGDPKDAAGLVPGTVEGEVPSELREVEPIDLAGAPVRPPPIQWTPAGFGAQPRPYGMPPAAYGAPTAAPPAGAYSVQQGAPQPGYGGVYTSPPPAAYPPAGGYPPPQQQYPSYGQAVPGGYVAQSGYVAPPGKATIWLNFAKLHARRAVLRDMRSVQTTPYEEPRLAARGVQELTVRQYLAWRRSWLYLMLPLAAFSAIFHVITIATEDWGPFTGFGAFILILVQLVQVLGFPVAAALAAWWWDQHTRSRAILVLGFAASFLLPIAAALMPLHWFFALNAADENELALQKQFIGLAAGAYHLFMLLPVVLALLPGVLRACVRIKSLLPESIVPGWFLVVSVPLYALILLLAFIAVNQVAGNLLLILGITLLMGAPVVYLWRTPLFIRPLATQEQRRQIDQLHVVYAGIMAAACLMLVIYVSTVKLFGRPLVGSEENNAFIGAGRMIWETIKFALNYAARSMFITAVAIDLFMYVNLSVWKHTKAFNQTPEAAAYDRLMASFQQVAEGKELPATPQSLSPAHHSPG